MAEVSDAVSSPRAAAVEALIEPARRFPDLWPGGIKSPGPGPGVSPNDAQLATAIHRGALQRWLTLEFLLDRHLNQPLRQIEPTLAAILLSGSVQLVLMQRVPAYAVVNEAVSLARSRVRQKAGGLVNAVLRKVAGDIAAVEPEARWTMGRDELPLARGRMRLSGPILPDPAAWRRYLAITTSHSPALIKRWDETFGRAQTEALCRHGLTYPTTIVAAEPGFDAGQEDERWLGHEQPGFLLWRGSHDELMEFLAGHPARRVQDPAAAQAGQATAELALAQHEGSGSAPGRILDLCAGRGTKTRQLATLHPHTRVLATDINAQRRDELTQLARALDNVEVTPFDPLPESPFNLIVLDAPCSNTGVLARRPEARYRYSQAHLDELTRTQQQLIEQAIQHLSRGGCLLYTTCSLDPAENEDQARFISGRLGVEPVAEQRWLPDGHGTSYHDGSYHALWRGPKGGALDSMKTR
jgi:16S rRNA (cytosine967-C5)-methyltransferase